MGGCTAAKVESEFALEMGTESWTRISVRRRRKGRKKI